MIEYVKILKESAYSDFRMAIARSSSQIDSAYLVFDIEENKKIDFLSKPIFRKVKNSSIKDIYANQGLGMNVPWIIIHIGNLEYITFEFPRSSYIQNLNSLDHLIGKKLDKFFLTVNSVSIDDEDIDTRMTMNILNEKFKVYDRSWHDEDSPDHFLSFSIFKHEVDVNKMNMPAHKKLEFISKYR